MSIPVVCPGCKKSFNVDDKHAGKSGACPNCKGKITIPKKEAEVTVHAPDEFSGGGKGVTGKLLLKPIAREKVRLKPVMAAVIGGAVVAAIIVALAMRRVPADSVVLRYLLSGVGLLLVSPALAVLSYTFLRDDELDPYRGMELLIRAAVCAVVYVILWAAFAYVKGKLADPEAGIQAPMWFIIAPPFFIVGAIAGKFSFDLETANGFFHYAFYVAATMLLAWVAGLGWVWQ
jgi:hypothetical protein